MPTSSPTKIASPTTTTKSPIVSPTITSSPTTSSGLFTTLEILASITWDVTCPLTDPGTVAEIVAKALYESINPSVVSDLQKVIVKELCGEVVPEKPYPPSTIRHLQSGQSEIIFTGTITHACSDCDNQIIQAIDAALNTIVLDGSLTASIRSISNGTLNATVGRVVSTSYSIITKPPTNAPTKSAKSTKNAKDKSGAPSTMKPAGSKSVKTDKNSKKN